MAERSPDLVRDDAEDQAHVGFAELFFDLVFVFAAAQLSHTLLDDLSPLGAVEVALLTCATWWCWVYTAWATNFLDPERVRVRLLLFALMGAGLVLSMSIPQAFGERGATFAIALAAMQVGRGLFVAIALRGAGDGFLNFVRITLWAVIAGALWIWGGFAREEDRLAIWLAALGAEMAGPLLRFRIPGLGASELADWKVEGGHLAERCGLFVIIALGESILITGTTFAGERWDDVAIAGFLSAFVGSLAMWWIYFNLGAGHGTQAIAEEDHHESGRLARLAYTYIHIPIVAGIIVTAVSDELVLEHPGAPFALADAATLVGGPALYLIGTGLFRLATTERFPPPHAIGLAALAALAVGAPALDTLQLSLCATGVLVAVAIWETIVFGTRPAKGPPKKETTA